MSGIPEPRRDAVGLSTGLPETVLDDPPEVAAQRLSEALSLPPGRRSRGGLRRCAFVSVVV